jgi:hypothetical protein
MCFFHRDRYLLYNSGYDPAYAVVNPGIAAVAMAMQDAIAERAVAFDFLSGTTLQIPVRRLEHAHLPDAPEPGSGVEQLYSHLLFTLRGGWPMYSAVGRISRPSSCSIACAVQPAIRLQAKIEV